MKSAKLARKIILIVLTLVLAFAAISLFSSTTQSDRGFFRNYDVSVEAVEAKMLEEIAEYKTTLEFDNVPVETVTAAYEALFCDHPEFFWLGGGFNYTLTTYRYGNTRISMKLLLNADVENIPVMDKELKQAVSSIVSKVDASWSDYEKALYAHDCITESCSYDTEFIKSLEETEDDESAYSKTLGSTAYGCLVNHLAICSGYTNAFQLLMNELGVECGEVRGWAGQNGDSEAHIWNYITLDGENYYVDVTWDDAVDGKNQNILPDHSYFCVTGNELYKSHSLRDDEAEPNCIAEKYNYHIHSGYYLESYDYTEASRLVDLQSKNDIIELKFSSADELQRACADLFDSSSVFRIPSVSEHGYCTVWHRVCEDSCVLIMWIES